ncbi:circadian-associated transcriptional repressor [Opisthocomus hoazin]|uniref:circadian-associated transcriptional repressor n=1 Tax=Opisthocomus hoazin TaxID=30419 RepID=UPI003F53DCA9
MGARSGGVGVWWVLERICGAVGAGSGGRGRLRGGGRGRPAPFAPLFAEAGRAGPRPRARDAPPRPPRERSRPRAGATRARAPPPRAPPPPRAAARTNGGRGGGERRGDPSRCREAAANRRAEGAGPSGRHVRPRTCPRGAAAAGAEPAPGRDGESGDGAGGCGQEQAPPELNPGSGPAGGDPPAMEPPAMEPPAMEPPAHACCCGSPTPSPRGPSDSEAEGGGAGSPPEAPNPPRALPESPPGGKRPRKGEGGDASTSDGDRLFAQKCWELRGFIRPLAGLLEGLKGGRYDRGLSSFQQSVAMDRIQRIIGVLQKPEMGGRYLGTLLQVEGMLRLWFPHVAPRPAQDPAPPRRRRPPAGPPGAPRCRRRRLAGDTPGTSPRGGNPRCPRTATPAPDA